MCIFNLPNTHCCSLASLKPMPVAHQDISTSRLWESAAASSTKPAWQSAKVLEITSWYESTSNPFMAWMRCKSMVITSKQLLFPAPHHGRCWHHCCQQKTVLLSLAFPVSSPPVPLSDFHILCVGSQYIKVERLHSEFCSHIFSGDWTPGDIVKLEVLKRLHWGFGKRYYISCLDLKQSSTTTMHWNMKTITKNLNLANLLHPRQLGESL